MVTVELWELYEKDINAYHEMSFSEKLNIKRNPGADFIFLVQMGGFTTDERLALLKGIQENGGILSDETYEAIFGKPDKHGIEMARIQLTYNASIDGTTFVELEKEVSRKAAEKRMQFAGMFLLSLTISGSNEAQNPAPYDGNLDPNYRLDQIELNSKNGFKNYDYVPLPQTTLDWLKENYPMPGDAKFMGPMVDKGPGTKYDNININTLQENDQKKLEKIIEDIRLNGGSPIEISESATVISKTMKKGYQQIKYKWSDGIYNFESRWHTVTPGAVQYGNGTTWVITRTIPGNAMGQVKVVEYLVGDKWIDIDIWKAAEIANMAGRATEEQMRILESGHWSAK